MEVAEKFKELSGRGFGLFEKYRTEDADYIMLLMGSAAGTAKQAVDEMREQGKKVGVLKLRVFRPFPAEGDCRSVNRTARQLRSLTAARATTATEDLLAVR